MNYLCILFVSMQCLLCSYASAENYTAITSDLEKKDFIIENGSFIFSPDEFNNKMTHFHSLNDFSVYAIYASSSFWQCSEYTLKSYIPSEKFPGFDFKTSGEVGFGTFSFQRGWGLNKGQLVLGKSLSQDVLEKLKAEQALFFEGCFIADESEYFFLKVSPQTGSLEGVMGDYLVESSPKEFDGTFFATIYSQQPDSTKNIVGHLMVNIYGEDTFALAGAHVRGETDRSLVYLQMVDLQEIND